MQITTYILASIVSYLGLLLGVILIKLAPEEQNPGKKYFIFLKKILLFLIILFILFFYSIEIIPSLILLLIAMFLLFNGKFRFIKFLEKYYLDYTILGFIFFCSSKIVNLFVIESVLIFLYGIPVASLIFKIKKKNYIDIFKNASFFVPIILLYLLL